MTIIPFSTIDENDLLEQRSELTTDKSKKNTETNHSNEDDDFGLIRDVFSSSFQQLIDNNRIANDLSYKFQNSDYEDRESFVGKIISINRYPDIYKDLLIFSLIASIYNIQTLITSSNLCNQRLLYEHDDPRSVRNFFAQSEGKYIGNAIGINKADNEPYIFHSSSLPFVEIFFENRAKKLKYKSHTNNGNPDYQSNRKKAFINFLKRLDIYHNKFIEYQKRMDDSQKKNIDAQKNNTQNNENTMQEKNINRILYSYRVERTFNFRLLHNMLNYEKVYTLENQTKELFFDLQNGSSYSIYFKSKKLDFEKKLDNNIIDFQELWEIINDPLKPITFLNELTPLFYEDIQKATYKLIYRLIKVEQLDIEPENAQNFVLYYLNSALSEKKNNPIILYITEYPDDYKHPEIYERIVALLTSKKYSSEYSKLKNLIANIKRMKDCLLSNTFFTFDKDGSNIEPQKYIFFFKKKANELHTDNYYLINPIICDSSFWITLSHFPNVFSIEKWILPLMQESIEECEKLAEDITIICDRYFTQTILDKYNNDTESALNALKKYFIDIIGNNMDFLLSFSEAKPELENTYTHPHKNMPSIYRYEFCDMLENYLENRYSVAWWENTNNMLNLRMS